MALLHFTHLLPHKAVTAGVGNVADGDARFLCIGSQMKVSLH